MNVWITSSSICYGEPYFKIPNNIKESIEFYIKAGAKDQFQSKIGNVRRAHWNKEHEEMNNRYNCVEFSDHPASILPKVLEHLLTHLFSQQSQQMGTLIY